MKAEYTPGPWQWEGNTLAPVSRDPERSAVHSILDAEGGYGFLGSKPGDTLRELDADRLLIAAAPELLEILRITRGNVASLGPAGALAQVYTPYQEWLAQIDAVIAKAIGSAA